MHAKTVVITHGEEKHLLQSKTVGVKFLVACKAMLQKQSKLEHFLKSGMEETSLSKPAPRNQETVFARSLPF